MRILFCLSQVPREPFNGFQLAVHNLLDGLVDRHEVRVIALEEEESFAARGDGVAKTRPVPSPSPSLAGNLRDLATSRVYRTPLRAPRAARTLQPHLRQQLHEFRPDVVHVSHGELAMVAGELTGTPAVLACLDAWHRNVEANLAVTSGLQRIYLRSKLRQVRRFEASRYHRFDRVTTVTTEDAMALREVDPRLAPIAIPNGVDIGAWPARTHHRPGAEILLHGAMAYAPNIDAASFLAREILPLVHRRRPDAVLNLVGRSPDPAVRRLADLPGVRVTGDVPELAPWMAAARVYACPMRTGTGIKNKLLEALASGVPAVATPLALQGVDATAERHLLVASNAPDFADQIVRVLDDDDLAARLGAAGAELVRQQHTWAAVADAYIGVYEEAISTHLDGRKS
jgi:polysaccharide biosynthesis protein PslH